MENTYSKRISLRYSDVDNKLTLKPSHLVGIMQNVASSHSNEVGYDLNWFKKNNMAWLLTFWHIKINRLPVEEEKVTCYTWSEQHKSMQAQRDFVLQDCGNDEIAYGVSKWVLINTEKKKPMKVDKDFYRPYLFDNQREVRDYNEKNLFPKEAEECLKDFSFVTTRRDMDTNGHVNNATFVEWAIDRIPDKIYEQRDIKEIAVSYKKECKINEKILVVSSLKNLSREKKLITSEFLSEECPDIVYAKVSTLWK